MPHAGTMTTSSLALALRDLPVHRWAELADGYEQVDDRTLVYLLSTLAHKVCEDLRRES